MKVIEVNGKHWYQFNKYQYWLVERKILELQENKLNRSDKEFTESILIQMRGEEVLIENEEIVYQKDKGMISIKQYKILSKILSKYCIEVDLEDPGDQLAYHNEQAQEEIEIQIRINDALNSMGTDWS